MGVCLNLIPLISDYDIRDIRSNGFKTLPELLLKPVNVRGRVSIRLDVMCCPKGSRLRYE